MPKLYLRLMEYGISTLAIIPIRAEARDQSEMVSQLLFGETYEILERLERWVRIITTFDGYEGWISFNQVSVITANEYKQNLQEYTLTTLPITTITKLKDDTLLYLPFGSTLPAYNNSQCSILDNTYTIAEFDNNATSLLGSAQTFLNTAYLWGGRTHFGVDCSGFVQSVYRQHGINLRRDAYLQAEQGETVNFLPEAREGDLAFFDNDEGRIIHVGMMLNNEQIIHASGRVKIDRVDNHGIYSEEFKRYTHKLRIIKRFF